MKKRYRCKNCGKRFNEPKIGEINCYINFVDDGNEIKLEQRLCPYCNSDNIDDIEFQSSIHKQYNKIDKKTFKKLPFGKNKHKEMKYKIDKKLFKKIKKNIKVKIELPHSQILYKDNSTIFVEGSKHNKKIIKKFNKCCNKAHNEYVKMCELVNKFTNIKIGEEE